VGAAEIGGQVTLALWRKAVTAPKHAHRDNDNVIIIESEQGNSKSYTLDRLKRDHPETRDQRSRGDQHGGRASLKQRIYLLYAKLLWA
jgi:hypothetical protein